MHPAELGIALLTGRAGKPWGARAIRARAFLAGPLGGAPPQTPAEPFALPSSEARPSPPPVDPRRPQALERAKDLLDALAVRRFDRLAPMLADPLGVLWPNGSFSFHARDDLLEELSRREGERARINLAAPRSYTFRELRAVLARGVAEALDAVLDLKNSLAVSIQINGGRGPGGRVMLVLALDEAKEWRARTLTFGSPDDAYFASARSHEPRSPDLGIADQIIRHSMLGHGTQLRSLSQHLMPKLWLRDQLLPAEALFEIAEDGPARLGASELVFLETKEGDVRGLSKLVPQAVATKIQQTALETFGLPFERLRARLSTTAFGVLDPSNGRIQPAGSASCLLVRLEEPSGELRPRVAGVFP